MKTRHQKRPAETGGRNGASIAKFRTRRPAHICETSRYRAVFERPSYVTRWRRTGWLTRQSRSNRSLHQNSLLTGKLTRNFAVSGVVLQICHPINAKFQSLAVKFPKQKNREFFEANREITKLNRDQPGAVRHHLRNSLWPCPDTVLTGGRGTGIQRSPLVPPGRPESPHCEPSSDARD